MLPVPADFVAFRTARGLDDAKRSRAGTVLLERPPVGLADFRAEKELSAALDSFTNALGDPLHEDARRGLLALVEGPVTGELWENAHATLLNRSTTLWQAMSKHTTFRVASVPSPNDFSGHIPAGETAEGARWPVLPTSDEVRYALLAVHARESAGR